MTLFRPCIDLHDGRVKQIVGGSLRDDGSAPRTNFVASEPPAYFAGRYRSDGAHGGHVIKLGAGNDDAAREALAAWPSGLHLGGGVTVDNARGWLDAGAGKVIVTSWLFPDGTFAAERAAALAAAVGREHVVIDLSCRRVGDHWLVATERWQRITAFKISPENLIRLADWCSEFLIHAADVEGLCQGIDAELVEFLGRHCPIPCVYAGGGKHLDDLRQIDRLSGGRVDLTYGSALDLFGGTQVRYADCIAWNHATNSRFTGNEEMRRRE